MPRSAAPSSDTAIHFGHFIRHHRLRLGRTTEAFARQLGISPRRLIAIETLPTDDIHKATRAALAEALGFDDEAGLTAAWRSTPVPSTPRRRGPSTDQSQRFAAACQAAGVSGAEAMRRLRAWLLTQDAATQKRILSFRRPKATASLFSDVVDHRQDPAETARRRIAARAKAQAGDRRSAASRSQPS